MEIYLIRHTNPDIEKGICYGQSDIGVKESFNDEVENILNKYPYLKSLESQIYSSPLSRCKRLAETLFDTPIQSDDRLKELDFGDWELQKWEDIDQNELSIWMKDFVHVKCTNGESYLDLNQRVLSFLEELKITKHDTAVIVTHGGVIRALHAHFNTIELVDSFDFKPGFGEVLKLTTPIEKVTITNKQQ